MNPIITEQLNKFKNGDFGGYESFYNETVNTVYTMLHTVVHDSNVATSLVPQVYDKIYQNVTSLEQTNGFYQWAAELANEEALGYLKENGWTEIHNDSVENTYEQAVDGKFYDYAVEDEAVIEAGIGQGDEVIHGVGGLLGVQLAGHDLAVLHLNGENRIAHSVCPFLSV